MKQCKCGSWAINHHKHGRDGTDDDLCDVCYWRKRAALTEPEVQSTHSAECYKWHHGCAIARIEAALKEKNHEPR